MARTLRRSGVATDDDNDDTTSTSSSRVERALDESSSLSVSRNSSTSLSFTYSSSPLVLVRKEQNLMANEHDSNDSSSDSDVDSRCEFEIKGVAPSPPEPRPRPSLTYLDLPSTNTKRTYRHLPNTRVNKILTFLSIVAVFAAIGLGIGHFYGSMDEKQLQKDQMKQMKVMQDNYMVCLLVQKKILRSIDLIHLNYTKDKLVSDEWKSSYGEVMSEKISLQLQFKEALQYIENLKLALVKATNPLVLEHKINKASHQLSTAIKQFSSNTCKRYTYHP